MGRFHPAAALTVPELLAATGGRLLGGPDEGRWTLCTDSREMADGAVFVALKGELHDGHRYVGPTLAAHRAGALVSDAAAAPADPPGPVLLVPDTLVAFGDIARDFLARRAPPVAAVTGSVGKTTTREMLASILAQGAPGLCTEGNFNNRIGVPLTLLGLRPEHRWVVLEMGMSEPGEIRELARIARPRVRLITWVSEGHLEFFDDVTGIADAKGELFEGARPGDALVFPHGEWFSERFPRPTGARAVSFGIDAGDVHALRIEDRGWKGTRAKVSLFGERIELEVPLPGRHQLHDALGAAAAAAQMGSTADHIVAGLAAVELPGRRFRLEERGGVTVVDDAYNASPASVRAALEAVRSLPREGRLVVALGDMLELGPHAVALHGQIGVFAAEVGVDLLGGAGPLMAQAVGAASLHGLDAVAVIDSEAAGDVLSERLKPGDLLLVKGSRGMRMERVLDALRPTSEG